MAEVASIEIAGFSSFQITQQADGKRSFSGSAKIKGGIYFFSARELRLNDGSRILAACRWETFTGKPVRGSANVLLEDLADVAREAVATATLADSSLAASPAMA